MHDAIVIALGGSLLSSDNGGSLDSWKSNFTDLMVSISSKIRIVIVVGGGKLARKNISIAKKNGISNSFDLDLIGIEATRINAKEIIGFFSNSNLMIDGIIPETIADCVSYLNENNIVVMGGTVPGHTTDTVAIKMGAKLNSKLVVIATNVSHVFTSDPRNDSNAKPIERMTLDELGVISGIGKEILPGSSFAVDPVGVKIAIEHNLPLVILNGHDVDNLRKALCGESFDGTKVYGVEN
ncbi:MAG: Uridylate kinase [Methanobacteriota archaeon]|nr:MAG: Uridylate kinase [Euryarchaeota archaeon]